MKLLLTLTEPELNHLYALLMRNEEDGVYSGPRAQYWARHHRVLHKVEDAQSIARLEDEPDAGAP